MHTLHTPHTRTTVCLKRNKSLKSELASRHGDKVWNHTDVEQWAIGAIDRSTDTVRIEVLPAGGRKRINAKMASDYWLKKTLHRFTLLSTDSARYYSVRRRELLRQTLAHVRCNHKKKERVKKDMYTKGKKAVGTQRCVCVCVCVCVCACVHVCARRWSQAHACVVRVCVCVCQD